MPLTQAEMDFMTNHVYELHNFDRPTPAHEALRSLDPGHSIAWQKIHLFQYLWQEQARREGPDELFEFWVEPATRSSFTLPWPTLEAFDARHRELYPEMILRQFEGNDHPLRFPRFVPHRQGRFSSRPIPVFTPEENDFLDAYYDEIRSLRIGPCLTAVDDLKIPHDQINHLVGYRATELLHEGRPWPQAHTAAPPIPWSSLEDFKRRFLPPRPDFPPHHRVTLDRSDFSAKEHAFFAHYLHEMTTLTPGPAHEYLGSQSLSPILMIPFLFGRKNGGYGLAGKYLSEPLPAFEIPWGTRSILFGRVRRFCESDAMKKLVAPFLPSEDSAYIDKPVPYRFYLNREEEGFVRWYMAETADATGGLMPATQWLWTNGVYPSTLEAFLRAFHQPNDYFSNCDCNNPLPPFWVPWLGKEEYEERLKIALESFPELKDKPSALPGYRPEGYEEKRMAWLRSIPAPPALDSFPALRMTS